MKDTLTFILGQLVDHPESISVDEVVEGRRIMYVIHAEKEDIGKIIGRKGRIIRAIRDIVKMIATKENAYVDIEIAE